MADKLPIDDRDAEDPRLRRAIERALEMRKAAMDLNHPEILELSELILFELGRCLAKSDPEID